MRQPKLTELQIENALAGMPDWQRQDETIQKTFQFESFVAAFEWMARVASIAEELDHHPDWRNVYRRVEVTLTTHDSKGLTALDIDMARRMNAEHRLQ